MTDLGERATLILVGMLPLRHVVWIGLAVGGLACTPAPNHARPARLPPVPHATSGRFAILVADFQGDLDQNHDARGDTSEQIALSLEAFSPLDTATPLEKAANMHLQVLRLGRFVSVGQVPEDVDPAYHRHEVAREWLAKTGAHLLIWGEVASGSNPRINLQITGLRDRPFGQAFPSATEFSIPYAQFADFRPFLFLALAAEASGYEDLSGLGLQDELAAWLGKTETHSSAFSGDFDILASMAWQARATQTADLTHLDKAAYFLQREWERKLRTKARVDSARILAMRAHINTERDALATNEASLTEALRDYEQAEKELTLSQTPLDFGLLHNLLGKSHERMAVVRQDKMLLCAAVDAYWKAALITSDGVIPRYTDVSLRGTLRGLAELTKGLPAWQKPECNPPIAEGLWAAHVATRK